MGSRPNGFPAKWVPSPVKFFPIKLPPDEPSRSRHGPDHTGPRWETANRWKNFLELLTRVGVELCFHCFHRIAVKSRLPQLKLGCQWVPWQFLSGALNIGLVICIMLENPCTMTCLCTESLFNMPECHGKRLASMFQVNRKHGNAAHENAGSFRIVSAARD